MDYKEQFWERMRERQNESDSKIFQGNESIAYANAKKKQEELEAIKKAEIEKEREREAMHQQQAFRKVKQAYKNRSAWDRMTLKLQGRAPKWKKVSQYSSEELQHLLAVKAGNTYQQQKLDADRLLKERQNYSPREIREKQDERHWNSFIDQMNSHSKLKNSMEIEENNKGRSR